MPRISLPPTTYNQLVKTHQQLLQVEATLVAVLNVYAKTHCFQMVENLTLLQNVWVQNKRAPPYGALIHHEVEYLLFVR